MDSSCLRIVDSKLITKINSDEKKNISVFANGLENTLVKRTTVSYFGKKPLQSTGERDETFVP